MSILDWGKTSLQKFDQYLKVGRNDSTIVIEKILEYLEYPERNKTRHMEIKSYMMKYKKFRRFIDKYKTESMIKNKKLLRKMLPYWLDNITMNAEDYLLIEEMLIEWLKSIDIGLIRFVFEMLKCKLIFNHSITSKVWDIMIDRLNDKNLDIASEFGENIYACIDNNKKKFVELFKYKKIAFVNIIDILHLKLNEADSAHKNIIYKLIANIMCDRELFDIMLWYTLQKKYLKDHINSLNNMKLVNYIVFFDVFKLFIANPDQCSDNKKVMFKRLEEILEFMRILPLKINNLMSKESIEQYNIDYEFVVSSLGEIKEQYQRVKK